MNCNCKADIEEKLTERHANQNPEAKNHKATIGGYGFCVVGNKMVIQGYSPITTTADHLVKKSGEYKAKKAIGNMIWSFCPFCGKPAHSDKEGGAK